MSYEIKQSSTEAALLFFLTLASDHLSPATGLSPTVTLSKNGGAFASPSGAVSEISAGWYKVAANATDTNTLGPLALHASVATADNCDLVVGNIVAYDPQDKFLGIMTSQLTESYAAAGTVPTPAQALQMILQSLLGFSGSGTTLTIYKRDNATQAMAGTWDNSSNATTLKQTT